MSNLTEAITFTITWHTGGPRPCRKCIALNGYVWQNEPIDQPWLEHPQFGPVWDMQADTSLAHPHCYCTLDVEVEVDLERLEID